MGSGIDPGPTGGETLEEWDGTAGTAVAYIRTLEADRARLRAENHEGYSNLLAANADLEDARAEVERLEAERDREIERVLRAAGQTVKAVARAHAAEARAARLEEELTVERDYWHERADEWEAEGDGSEATFALQHAERIHRALNREGGEHGR